MISLVTSVDREDMDRYDFKVFVMDSGQPVFTSTTSVTVYLDDVNDNPPLFSADVYTAHVSEDHFQPGQKQVLHLV